MKKKKKKRSKQKVSNGVYTWESDKYILNVNTKDNTYTVYDKALGKVIRTNSEATWDSVKSIKIHCFGDDI